MEKETTKWVVRLSDDEEQQLQKMIGVGTDSARKLARARVLLKSNQAEGREWLKDKEIAKAVEVGHAMVERVRKRFVTEGLSAALNDPPVRDRPHKKLLDGKGEAYLIAVACGDPPDGRSRWTLQLLADRMVELQYCDQLSDETVRRILKKTSSNLGKTSSGA